jgi:hypothetical protein
LLGVRGRVYALAVSACERPSGHAAMRRRSVWMGPVRHAARGGRTISTTEAASAVR